MPQTNLGRVAFKFQGDYSALTTYAKYDVVFDGESSFVSQIDNNLGNELVDGLNWKYLAKGNNLSLQDLKQDVNDLETDLNELESITDSITEVTISHITKTESNAVLLGKRITTSTFPNFEIKTNRAVVNKVFNYKYGSVVSLNLPPAYKYVVISANSYNSPTVTNDGGWVAYNASFSVVLPYFGVQIARIDDAVMGPADLIIENINITISADIDQILPIGVSDLQNTLSQIIEKNEQQDYTLNSANILSKIGSNPFRFGQMFYHHLGLDQNFTSNYIPVQSLDDIDLAARLGMKVYEVNSVAVKNGMLATHGSSPTTFANYTVWDNLNNQPADGINISNMTIAEIKDRFIYRCILPKYATPPTEMSEALLRIKQRGMVPFIRISQYDIDFTQTRKYVQDLFGDDYIAYEGIDGLDNGWRIHWLSNGTRQDVINYIDLHPEFQMIGINVGVINTMMIQVVNDYSGQNFTDLQSIITYFDSLGEGSQMDLINNQIEYFKYLSDYAHAKRRLIGWAGVYTSEQVNQLMMMSGYDLCASGRNVNDFENGNICNLAADTNFSDFEHNGSLNSKGNLYISSGGFIRPNYNFSNYNFANKGAMWIRFKGTLNIRMYVQLSNTYNKIVSDGQHAMYFSSYFLNKEPTFDIQAVTNTEIYNISYKASKI